MIRSSGERKSLERFGIFSSVGGEVTGFLERTTPFSCCSAKLFYEFPPTTCEYFTNEPSRSLRRHWLSGPVDRNNKNLGPE
ncbi:hypothetical protein CEXT_114891 [Caerostris extrusa]|uniref:Uncharacterized protein n=1 Tax=Caerostris extrusa TaxID=172846 RepID=A0AAV4SKW6_CAEEX|nr:hypothetical protein CEXT_114891 [Caerostris extrusa]